MYYEIANDAFEESEYHLAKNSLPKPDGGYIRAFDPHRLSFKNGLISTLFCGSYIDLHIRLAYIMKNGSAPTWKWDNGKGRTNKIKLEELGVLDVDLLNLIEGFGRARNQIAHEKPIVFGIYSSGSISGTAQESAKLGITIINCLRKALPLSNTNN